MSLDPTSWGWPFPATAAALFLVALLRAGATHVLGRALRRGAEHSRLARLLERPGYQRAEQLVDRWGAPAVALSFLTVGLQTLVNLASGVTRMSWWRYLPGLVVGAVLWGLLYAGVGFAGFAAFVELWRRSPVLAVGVLVVLAVALALLLVRRRTRPAA
ncbi:DedA family protein [Desertihabitans aurantiacus]|uniref:DedA family protein n=1 Tax=Desertihabitans aurantiacus TaxID=2282477 RepID=UPI000DF7B5B0|nr:VTT domain-containing protein [Desertihabitans aurantiacus]